MSETLPNVENIARNQFPANKNPNATRILTVWRQKVDFSLKCRVFVMKNSKISKFSGQEPIQTSKILQTIDPPPIKTPMLLDFVWRQTVNFSLECNVFVIKNRKNSKFSGQNPIRMLKIMIAIDSPPTKTPWYSNFVRLIVKNWLFLWIFKICRYKNVAF